MNRLSTARAVLHVHAARALRLGSLAGLLAACSPRAASNDDAVEGRGVDAIGSRAAYVAIEEALPGKLPASWERLRTRLFEQFDDVCGDTFCEGDWSNLEPLDLACSASSKLGAVRECVWTFGASQEVVDAADGSIETSVALFSCSFRPTGNAAGLLHALEGDPLHAPIPGGDTSIYDALSDCFAQPRGAEPLDGASDGGPYADVAELLDEETMESWYAMTSRLRGAARAEVAGASGAAHPLRFRCSEDRETGLLDTCVWVFAGTDVRRRASGLHRVIDARHVCRFAPGATPAELAAALSPNATANVGALDLPLPGTDRTMRDVLDACW